VYFQPYFSADEHRQAQEEIDRSGFRDDPLLERLDEPVMGLNVAFAWPLPAAFRAEYERLYRELRTLGDALYVYPYERTHVTVATLVSFRRFPDPTAEQDAAVRALVPTVARVLGDAVRDRRAFTVDVGPPVLVRAAAFLPILNPGAEVRRIREALREGLAGHDLLDLGIPGAVHSTIVRFRRAPKDTRVFRSAFEDIAKTVRLGPTVVDELIITTETRPYMAAGTIAHRIALGR
jgi:hypothetical protein